MTLYAFGERAARIAGPLGESLDVIACEPEHAAAALGAALELRRSGRHFAATIVMDDERARRAGERSEAACAQVTTWDEVRLLMHAFTDGLDAETRPPLPSGDRSTLHEFVRLGDRLIVRSIAERQRIEAALGSLPREADVVVRDAPLAAPMTSAPTDIVVFAPFERGDALAMYVTALADLNLPVTIVARDPARIASPAAFVAPGGAAAALGRARVIVDATGDDPGVARMLARFGRPLAVSAAGGATEILSNVTTFEPWNRASILAAVADGLGGGPPVLRPAQPPSAPPRWPAVDRPGPSVRLVSVIVTTFNRPVILGDTLAAIERQTYPALEIIVVNDAGADVAGVVAGSPRARLIDQPENRGPAAARNAGLRAARGDFILFFDDDDEMFPDHVGALAGALERSGLDGAYGQMINGFASTGPDGRFVLERVLAHEALLDHAEIQWGGSLATTAVMFRRRLADAVGPIDESLPANEDFEYWMRLAAAGRWARVSAVTSLYFVRTDGSNRSAQNARRRYLDAHRTIFEKHPSSRALVNAGRSAMLQMFEGAPA